MNDMSEPESSKAFVPAHMIAKYMSSNNSERKANTSAYICV